MTRLLMILSIICLLGLLTCGTALADIDLTIDNAYNGNITITVNSGGTTVDIEQVGQTTLTNVPISELITISQTNPSILENTIFVVGNNVLTADPIQIKIQNLRIGAINPAYPYTFYESPFALTNNANVKLILGGDNNVLQGGTIASGPGDGSGQAGLNVPAGSKIWITSEGTAQKKLTATGGRGSVGGAGMAVMATITPTAALAKAAAL